jgi:hypothetical protein
MNTKKFNAILKNKDLEKYKEYMDFNNMNDIQRDMSLLDFECMCKSYHNEWKTSCEFFTFKFTRFLELANKHNVNPTNLTTVLEQQLS